MRLSEHNVTLSITFCIYKSLPYLWWFIINHNSVVVMIGTIYRIISKHCIITRTLYTYILQCKAFSMNIAYKLKKECWWPVNLPQYVN